MIALIPARGGSKGLPRKNVLPFMGKPLIAHTIEQAKNSKCIDRIIVTTDDEEIASVAKQYGAEVPFMRPDYLASDTAMAVDVYIHAFEFLMEEYEKAIDHMMILLPTTPLRTSEDIDNAYELFVKSDARTLVAMREAPVPPSWYCRVDVNSQRVSLCNFTSANAVQNRQNNSRYYIPCGAIYILEYDLLKHDRTYYCENTICYEMPENRSADIDTIDDFKYAEFLYRQQKRID